MYKDTSYSEKFTILKNWLPQILSDVRKDLKKDHWKQDPQFVKNYLGNKPPQKITGEDMTEGYTKALQNEEAGEAIAEFIASRWLYKNSDIYHSFEQALSSITSDFTELQTLDADQADPIAQKSSELFGATNTYLFCVLNSVVFPEATYKSLQANAEKESKAAKKTEQQQEELKSQDEIRRHFESQIARMTDRYEKKLAGMERKYFVDTDGLKKQIRSLQKKLEGVRS